MEHDHGSGDQDVLLTGLTLFGMAVAGGSALGGGPDWLTAGGLVLVYLAGGIPAGLRALHELFHDRVLDIDLLMVVAALAAAWVGAAMEGAVLLTLFSLSGTLEHQAMGKARRAVEALMALRPETALREGPDGAVVEVPVGSLAVGDTVVIRPGARMPVDGTITRGEGSIDEATVTGESVPVRKGPGAGVFEATVNLDGVLSVRVDRSASESTVARMIQLVTEAQAAKAPSERFSAWFGQRYTVAVLAGSVLSYVIFLLLGWANADAVYRAATVLVAASPCAVVISVPAAILSALSAAARGGVLFKGGAALETLGAVKSFAFDKTGTLTTGRAEVTEVVALSNDEDRFLALLAGIEAQSEHHIAGAVRRAVEARGVIPVAVSDVTALPSEGIVGVDADGPVWAGNPRLAARMGAALDIPEFRMLAQGEQTVIYLGRGDAGSGRGLGCRSAARDVTRGHRCPAGKRDRDAGDDDGRQVARRAADRGDAGATARRNPRRSAARGQGSPRGRIARQGQGRLRRRRRERCRSVGAGRCRHRHGRCGQRRGLAGG